jgi:DNA-binding response OmpR family regulator
MRIQRILVVDDAHEMRSLVQRILRVRGFVVYTADTGEDALWQLETMPFAGMLVDFHLPGLHGEALCRQIKAISSAPILMISGNDRIDLRALVDAQLADAFLFKPFAMQDMLETMDQLLRQGRLNAHHQTGTPPSRIT